MTRLAASLLALLLVAAAPLFAQADVAGEWAVTFETPGGPEDFTMFVVQEGTRLSGRLTSDVGEFGLKGTVDEGNHVRIVWSLPEQGKLLEITFMATIDGDSMKGTAKLGNLGQGQMSAERTGR
jgi:hypothetical protein